MLLDAASLYFRAFYGVPGTMRAPDGTPTNAVRGFTDMISTLLNRYPADSLVACLDEDWRPLWRVELISSYKTHRIGGPDALGVGGAGPGEAEPPELAVQVRIILELLEAIGIAAIGAPRYEADDVIATLVERATGPVNVVTGDRDLFQLIDDSKPARILYTGRGVAKLEEFDGAALHARYGVYPEQYVDYAVLRGDASDGLPGVAGIGEKTAASLLATFGSLAGMLSALDAGDKRLGAQRRKLEAARDYLAVAPTVVRTARDVDMPDFDATLPAEPADPDALAKIGERYGVGNAIGRLLAVLKANAQS